MSKKTLPATQHEVEELKILLKQKNRELEIEAALERVRTRTMAMQQSDELSEVVAVLYEQMIPLGFAALGCELILCDKKNELLQFYTSSPEQAQLPECYPIPRAIHPFFQQVWQAWEKETPHLVITLKGIDKRKFDKLIFEKTAFKNFPESVKKAIQDGKIDVFSLVTMKYGLLEVVDVKPLTKDKFPILEQFAKVFEQTYTRFLDLQKAEAQAREAQIEAALERVRAASMAMHKTNELRQVVGVLFQQFSELELDFYQVWINIFILEEGISNCWFSPVKGVIQEAYTAIIPLGPFEESSVKSWRAGEEFSYLSWRGLKEVDEIMKALTEMTGHSSFVKIQEKKRMDRLEIVDSNHKYGVLAMAKNDDITEEDHAILKRFTKVFEQAYTRFLDLQKAEARASEAQIEAALERVRSRSLAMHKSEELVEVATVLYGELRNLEIREFSDASIIIVDEKNNQQIVWGARTESDYLEKAILPLLGDHVLQRFYDKWRQKEAFFTLKIGGVELRNHLNFVFPKGNRTEIEDLVIKGMPDPTFFHCAFFSMGYLELVADKELSEDSSSVLIRFAKVFEQTYTRFLDLQKAETQVREAEIQLALERVRARAMAMHKSEELGEVSILLYEQLKSLGITDFFNCGYVEVDQKRKIQRSWMTRPDGSSPGLHQLPLRGDHILNRRYSAWKKQQEIFHQFASGDKLKKHIEFGSPHFANKEIDKMVESLPDPTVFYCGNFQFGYLHIVTGKPIGKEAESILARFTKVFEQAYTRFLDLQKTEAQAREAQIEVALERIRARALAMHTSEELEGVADVLREQMRLLGQPELEGTVVELMESNPGFIESWHAFRPGGNPKAKMIKGRELFAVDSCKVIRELVQRYQSTTNEYTIIAKGQKLKEWVTVLGDKVPEVLKISPPETFYYHCSDFSGGTLMLSTAYPPSVEAKRLLSRSAKVFDLAYKRFLDLQKAQAQAREAQIEASLERVRSHTMAMHESDDLQHVVSVLYEQLDLLGLADWGCSIMIFDEDSNRIENWIAESTGSYLPRCYYVEGQNHPVYKKLWEYWKQQGPPLTLHHKDEVKREFDNYWLYETGFKALPEKVKSSVLNKREVFLSYTSMRHGLLEADGYECLPQEKINILERFAKVFEQTYTRFLDLQKAEAQTREAQIETSLERVRASAMAMHKSEELTKVAKVLYKELKLLGLTQSATCGFVIIDERERIQHYYGSPAGKNFLEYFKFSLIGDQVLRNRYEAWKRKDPVFNQGVGGKKLQKHLSVVLLDAEISEAEKEAKLDMPDPTHFYFGNFAYGYLQIIASNNLSEDQISLLPRFAQVFEQAYTRFLDLQKAEAQARESQIELALERVRARAMAMQKSDELKELIGTVFTELTKLDLVLTRCIILIFDPKSNGSTWWMANSETPSEPIGLYVEYHDQPPYLAFIEAWKERNIKWQYILEGKVKTNWDDVLFSETELSQLPDFVIEGMKTPDKVYLNASFNNFGNLTLASLEQLSNEQFDIMLRFAKVFDLTYTRFNDLQRAEAQAREAQIEAALERIRARSMAMHESHELKEVIACVFEQLQILEFVVPACSLIFYQEDMSAQHWFAGFSHDEYPESYTIPFIDIPYYTDMVKTWQEGQEYGEFIMKGKAKVNYAKWLLKESEFKNLPKEFVEQSGMLTPAPLYFADAFNKYGMVEVIGNEPMPEDNAEVLKRISKVFEQTYTRFLDLQKAEAQAREAQIEAALERVRARSMAMHKSEELQDVINQLFTEIESLGVKMGSSYLVTEVDEDITKGVHIWLQNNVNLYAEKVHLAYLDHPLFHKFYKAWWDKTPFYTEIFNKKEKNRLFNHLFKHSQQLSAIPDERKKYVLDGSGFSRSVVFYKNVAFIIQKYDDIPFKEEEINIQKRFGSVFEQTYTRFLDLQKAEQQAREKEIEAALERVRSKTMAMHNSSDVAATVATLFDELVVIGLDPKARCGIAIFDKTKYIELWTASVDSKGKVYLSTGKLDMTVHPLTIGVRKSWNNKREHYSYVLEGDDLVGYFKAINDAVEYSYRVDLNSLPSRVYFNDYAFSDGILYAFTEEPLSQEISSVLKRFALVFGQTYRRYLDLVKAEAQAWEAQIEAALERVRARSMAMHKSEELQDVINQLFTEIDSLGVHIIASYIVTNLDEDIIAGINVWVQNNEQLYTQEIYLPYLDHPMFHNFYSSWSNKTPFYTEKFTKKEKNQLFRHLFKHSPQLKAIPEERKKYILDGSGLTRSVVIYNNAAFVIQKYDDIPFSEEEINIQKRFGGVFEQTYTRFLDLQKAEAQAREAEIQLALERVRARTMAMHKSEELREVVNELFEQMNPFGLAEWGFQIRIAKEDKSGFFAWLSTPAQRVLPERYDIPTLNHWALKKLWSIYEDQKPFDTVEVSGEDKLQMDLLLFEQSDLERLPKQVKQNIISANYVLFSVTSMKYGLLEAIDVNHKGSEEVDILQRFAKVFEQTYTRFLDLQKAEAQARDSQIEAALERIRAKALAMQTSADLHDVSIVLREQMGNLGQKELESSLIHLYNNCKTLESWYTFRSTETDSTKIVTDVAIIPVDSCDYIKETIKKYNSKESEYTIVSKGKKLVDWYNVMVKVAPDTIEYDAKGQILVPDILYYHHSKFTGGALLMISTEMPSEESKELQRRAAKVFNLAYQRFLDLQQAEARARETVKQASLDRVRGEIASMRTIDDLHRITPLIWQELIALGVPFIRCGVFIMDEENKIIESHLSSPDGKSLGLLNLPYDANKVSNNSVKYWRKGKIYKDHWNKDQFLKFMQKMVKLGRLENPELYQGATSPPESLDLHFVPFKQGMLYVGNIAPLNKDEIQLVQSLAEAFSIAYARYEDFNQLEQAKNQIEQALSELRSTQTQLIHSEKMASLGELTAGIAHEIQNPLNFVNNFSEVSADLIEELKEELAEGNSEEVVAISEDIIQNLEKIHHHGQRASSIVKGMLEHSRTGIQEKELTDLNVLADEYLRLAYHGLRAKDKSFNAEFKADLDYKLPKINLIAQDIGRVLLNLINNAFYAVSKKSKEGIEGYKPSVTISTKKVDKTAELCVQDNGGGVPKEVVDKIFQPFFTTKPTGQGTGLGLSLSYDIITKGHDGHLEFETEEGMGTRFVIRLPIV